jgi:hypothetical protein
LIFAASGALALSGLLAVPAAAAPISEACVTAEGNLSTARGDLAAAQGKLNADRAAGAALGTIQLDEQAVSNAQAALTIAQAAVTAQCGTTTTPGPVGFPRPVRTPVPRLTCAEIGSNVPSTSPNYRSYLDINGDGIACETVTSPPVGTVRVVNHVNCRWDGTAWVPVDPCNCTTTPTPEPSPPPVVLRQPVIVQQPVQVVQPAPEPVFVAPAPSSGGFTQIGTAPVGSANTGGGPF